MRLKLVALILPLTLSLLAAPVAVEAEQAGRSVYRICALTALHASWWSASIAIAESDAD